ncbi:hypothetical protein IPM09_01945 [Candidatus Saccharibacteria bacterium]|nr:MAG: hypothetical protein IPM09_01945 [Candidatus Saccharibacteria bacterium]
MAAHIDHDKNGAVEECRWFLLDELSDVKVLPKFVKQMLTNPPLDKQVFIDE